MKTTFTLFILIISIFINAQNIKFGVVTEEELSQTANTLNKDAEAAFLYEKEKVYFPDAFSEYNKEVHVRIKIYDKNKAGDLLTIFLPFINSTSGKELFSDFKASTYNLENGKIVETKVPKDQIFDQNVVKSFYLKKFTFPNVRNGSVIEYKYTISSPFTGGIPTHYFQHSVPTMYNEFSFEYPEFANYRPDIRGSVFSPQVERTKKSWGQNYTANVEKFIYRNVPALKREPFVLNPDNLKTSIRYELTGVTVPGYVYEDFSSSWSKIVGRLMGSQYFGDELKKDNFLKDEVEKMIQGKTASKEKAEEILKFVQNNITYNQYQSRFIDEGIKSAYKKKEGNVADINLLLVVLLREAKINAYPVVLATLDNGVINPSAPTSSLLNYVIAAYYDEQNELHLLDATSKYSNIDQLPKRCLNQSGILVIDTNKSYKEIPLMNKTISRKFETIEATIENDMIVGKYASQKNNYFSIDAVEEYDADKAEYEKELKENYGFDIQNISFVVDKAIFKTNFDFSYNKDVEVIGNKIIINPMLFFAQSETIFTSEERNYNLEFGTPQKITQKVNLKIPEGYKVESLPQPKRFLMPDEKGEYTYNITENNGTLVLQTALSLKQATFPPTDYEMLKNFWQEKIKMETQFITLIKN